MKICKIFKFILPLVVLVLLLFFWETILNLVVSANLVVSQRNLFGLTFIFFLEILFLLVIYDIIINKLYIEISYKLSELGKLAVRKKKVRFALYTIRLNYYFSRLSHLLRLGWVSYGSSENSSVWTGLSKQNLTQMAINIFRFLFSVSVPLILAVLSSK